jgi:phage protein U
MATPSGTPPIKYLVALGDIEFSAIQGVTGWDQSEASSLPEHSVITGKQKLQFLGTDLIDLTLTLKLSAVLTKTPVEWRLAELKAAQKEGRVLPLRLGAGFFKGYFVIKNLTVKPGKMLSNGLMVWAEVTIGLREFVESKGLVRVPANRPGVVPSTGNTPITTQQGG